MPDHTEYAGVAALSICEALLLALNDRKLLPDSEIVGVLRDAAATHQNAATAAENPSDQEMHSAAAALINGIIAGGNSARLRQAPYPM